MTEADKVCLEEVIPKSADYIDTIIENYDEKYNLRLSDYVYITCRLSGDFDHLQKKLWSQTSLTEREHEVLKKLAIALQNLPAYSGSKVYRVYANTTYMKEKQFDFFRKNIQNVFEIHAYLGASAKPWEDEEDYIWEIHLSHPSHNKSLLFENLGFDPEDDSEKEIIMLPNTKFKIIGIIKNTVLLEESKEDISCHLPVS